MTSSSALPPIVLGTQDYNRLMLTAIVARDLGHPHAEFLLSELRRATLSHPDDLPRDAAGLDSRVMYRVDGAAQARTRLLVHPDDLIWPGAEVGATTPLGIALLGMRPGHRMRYPGVGRTHEVLVEAVGFGIHELGLHGVPEEARRGWVRPAHELH